MMPMVPGEPHWAADIQEEKYLPYVVTRACQNFEYFYGLDSGTATPKMIDMRSSLTVAGWADAVLSDYGQIDRERGRRDGGGNPGSPTSGCWHLDQMQLMVDVMTLPLRLLAITMSKSPSSLAL